MAELKHTPGPWHAWDRGIGWEVHAGDPTGCYDPEGDCKGPIHDQFRDTCSEADARLMAAAPDLLEAAKRKLADCRETGDCSDAALQPGEVCSDECAALSAAIDKAEGR